MARCPRCARENDEEARFCGRCGLDLHEYAASQARGRGDQEQQFCTRHAKTPTNLACGRCLRPFCDRCLTFGPAGPRCKECGKHDIAFRPGAVVHGAKRGLLGMLSAGRYGVWPIYALVMLVITALGAVRSCGAPEASSERPVRAEAGTANAPSPAPRVP